MGYCIPFDGGGMGPQPGDHIYAARMGGLFDHHGIYVGNDRVIHMMGPSKKRGSYSSFSSSSSSSSYSSGCQNCGYNPDGQGGLVETCLNCFLDGYSLRIYEYGVSVSVHETKKRGTCSVLMSKPAHEVIQTARDLLERGKNGFGEYNVITNNCEHFAIYCKTGCRIFISEQVVDRAQKCSIM